MCLKQYLILLLLFAISSAAKVSYSGYELWRVSVEDETVKESLKGIVDQFDLDVWSASFTSLDFMVEPSHVERVQKALTSRDLTYEVVIPDIGVVIEEEEKRLNMKPLEFSLNDYNTFEDIEIFLSEIASNNDNVTLISIGKSVEQRDIWQLKFSVGGIAKPSAWIDCNIHAREWITGATCIYGINYLSEGYGKDPQVTAFLDAYDVFIVPINNPDGYSYTWTTDRLWRKNRNKYSDDVCYGVDNNRNFDDHFGGAGTSNNSCSQAYHGPSAASEPETLSVQNALKYHIENDRLTTVFTVHCYSLLWLYPFGYTTDLPPEVDELDRVSQVGVDALKEVNGTSYSYGPVASTFYPAASNTMDYAYAQGITYTFTLELRDEGEYGFLLPPEQIAPSGAETWAGIIASILAI